MVAAAQIGIFQGRGNFLEQGHFNKHFTFDTRKRDREGKNILNVLKHCSCFWKNFSLNILITSFL